VKRITLPTEANAEYIPSFPESGHACFCANSWLAGKRPCLIIISESISKAESWGEDIAAFVEQLMPEINLRLHLFDEAPVDDHPDAFERNCERASVLSLLHEIKESYSPNEKLIISTTPEALRSPCPILEDTQKSEIRIIKGQEENFSNLIRTLAGEDSNLRDIRNGPLSRRIESFNFLHFISKEINPEWHGRI
tara:strand:+ start:60 stop:641 length:582 start_codon:yes stop_codon:yes gene_type:complete